MNEEGFFTTTWTMFFPKVVPIPNPDNCYGKMITPADMVDDSLKIVLQRQTLRIGIHTVVASYPSLYSYLEDINTFNGSTNASNATTNTTEDTKIDTKLKYTTDPLNPQALHGHVPTNLRELTRQLSVAYQIDIQPDFVLISGQDFFNDLKNAVETNQVDVVWSVVAVTEERSHVVDYICSSHMSEYVIGASAKVGSKLPNPNGTPIPTVCYGIACTFPLPSPFYAVKGNLPQETWLTLSNTTDPYEYGILTYDTLWNYIRENDECNNCTQVLTSAPVYKEFRAPFTKRYLPANHTNQSTTLTSSSSSLLSLAFLHVCSFYFTYGTIFSVL
jgi:hypothetical protein